MADYAPIEAEAFHFRDRGMSGCIRVAQHETGHWMWSTSWLCGNEGAGYAVHPKWSRFAPTREAAIDCARCEIEVLTHGHPKFKAWAGSVGRMTGGTQG